MRSDEVIFVAAFDKDVIVKISSASGAGGNTYHLMFDNFYQGIIVHRDEWQVKFQLYRDDYTQADLDILVAKLTENINVTEI